PCVVRISDHRVRRPDSRRDGTHRRGRAAQQLGFHDVPHEPSGALGPEPKRRLLSQSVDFYPTPFEPQLTLQPLSEYAILHLQILVGSDRLANLVQWLGLVGCLFGVDVLAKALGADRWGRLVAVAFCATLPMAILQASSTQNDLTVSFWLLCSVSLLLRPPTTWTWSDTATMGAALGLSLLTKATAYLVVPPFVAIVALSTARAR